MGSVQAKMAIFFLRKLKTRAFRLIDDIDAFRREKEAIFSRVRPPKSVKIKEFTIEGLEAARFYPPKVRHQHKIVLYLHGGGYTSGSIKSHAGIVGKLALETGIAHIAINYGLAPEHPYPHGLNHAIKAYQWLMEEEYFRPEDIIIMGDSAGGGLTLSTLLKIKAMGLPQPMAAVVLSPWTDLTLSGDSALQDTERDPILETPKAKEWAGWYGGNDLKNPFISPLYGDLEGLPPILIQVGTEEILLSDSVRFATAAALKGVDIELDIWDDMPHVWHFFWHYIPESKAAIQKIVVYLDARIEAQSSSTFERSGIYRVRKQRVRKRDRFVRLYNLGKQTLGGG